MGLLTFNQHSRKEGNHESINSNMGLGLDDFIEASNAQKEVHSSSSLTYPLSFDPMHEAGGVNLHSHAHEELKNI